MQFTVAFNFLCVLLGLLYEIIQLSLSVQRKITANVFYSMFTNVFLNFCYVFTFFNVSCFFGERFLHLWSQVGLGRWKMATDVTAIVDNGAETVNDAASTQAAERDTQSVTAVVDPVTAMQAALASFDGLRVDAAIQVRLGVNFHTTLGVGEVRP